MRKETPLTPTRWHGMNPRPNIAIVSGLYELFPDNARVLASLAGLSRALADGGYLIYTNQPWHPQLEMIARVLINRDQKLLDHAADPISRDGRACAFGWI